MTAGGADGSDRALAELRAKVATACRILGHTGVAREITGHVSVRIPGRPGEILVR